MKIVSAASRYLYLREYNPSGTLCKTLNAIVKSYYCLLIAKKRLATVGSYRLPGWGPKDSEHAWLNTLEEMATIRCQWRSCCSFLIDP